MRWPKPCLEKMEVSCAELKRGRAEDVAGWFRDPYKGFICCPRSSLLPKLMSLLPKLMSLLPKMLPMLPNLALMRWSLSLNFEFWMCKTWGGMCVFFGFFDKLNLNFKFECASSKDLASSIRKRILEDLEFQTALQTALSLFATFLI